MKLATLIAQFTAGPGYATPEDIQKAFGDYHNVLHWLAHFLLGDETLAGSCIVDACTIAQHQSPMFHDWLIHWAARATVGCALRLQRDLVNEQAVAYATETQIEPERMLLSSDDLNILVEHSQEIHEQLDAFCRGVLILRGIARDSSEKVAAQLGIAQEAIEQAYSVALGTIRRACPGRPI
jgi:DNA-directed RNA polymerase specialized sigma24 family protein